jgi:hypothetical protein
MAIVEVRFFTKREGRQVKNGCIRFDEYIAGKANEDADNAKKLFEAPLSGKY